MAWMYEVSAIQLLFGGWEDLGFNTRFEKKFNKKIIMGGGEGATQWLA